MTTVNRSLPKTYTAGRLLINASERNIQILSLDGNLPSLSQDVDPVTAGILCILLEHPNQYLKWSKLISHVNSLFGAYRTNPMNVNLISAADLQFHIRIIRMILGDYGRDIILMTGRNDISLNADVKHLRDADEINESPELIETILKQTEDVLIFSDDLTAPIKVIDSPAGGLLDTPDQRQGHAEIVDKAKALERSCRDRNQLAALEETLSKLLQVAGFALDDVRVRPFWSQMNKLRRLLEIDQQLRKSDDPEHPPYPTDIAGHLRDLVDELNIFAALEPKLVNLDELRTDPADRASTDETARAAQNLTRAALATPKVVDRESAELLAQTALDASGDSPAANRARIFTTKSAQNLAIAALARAYKALRSEAADATKNIKEGAYRWVGTTAAAFATAAFVVTNKVAILTLVGSLGGNDTMLRIIAAIEKLLMP